MASPYTCFDCSLINRTLHLVKKKKKKKSVSAVFILYRHQVAVLLWLLPDVFPEDKSQALYPSCPCSLDSSEQQMREERFRAYIKPQTAPALTSYKTQHESQPNVNPLHPPLIPCGSVLHASEFKQCCGKGRRGGQRKWKHRLRWRWEMKRLKTGFRDRPVDPHDVGEDVWIIPSNKSH